MMENLLICLKYKAQREIVQFILEKFKQLVYLIDDMMDIELIDHGKLSIFKQSFSPVGVLNNAMATFAQQAKSMEIELFLKTYEKLSIEGRN